MLWAVTGTLRAVVWTLRAVVWTLRAVMWTLRAAALMAHNEPSIPELARVERRYREEAAATVEIVQGSCCDGRDRRRAKVCEARMALWGKRDGGMMASSAYRLGPHVDHELGVVGVQRRQGHVRTARSEEDS
eukprot:1180146-Prorocentrum_minimum.AAC.3